MPSNSSEQTTRGILLIAASRGLGLAMAEEFLKKGWNVVGTVRPGSGRTKLHDLADRFRERPMALRATKRDENATPKQNPDREGGASSEERLEIETLDICQESQVKALRQRLSGRIFDMLFVNAGTTNNETETIGNVTTDEFVRVMVTNALCPMRVVESLQELVTANGLIGLMSSGQGSVANNVNGMREVYRGSKAALNQFMRSYAARNSGTRAMVLMAPGWVRTDLGGPDARLSIEESVPNLVNVLLKKQGNAGLEYLDYLGRTVPW